MRTLKLMIFLDFIDFSSIISIIFHGFISLISSNESSFFFIIVSFYFIQALAVQLSFNTFILDVNEVSFCFAVY
jgi:hypothetical protein